jgi:hypothetical protein
MCYRESLLIDVIPDIVYRESIPIDVIPATFAILVSFRMDTRHKLRV